ncbi:MAG: hypothetical protein N3A58_00020 [Spirochaetes bacterium]|nr:hypothetical protein [Spirochaetota bacterium]
MFRVFTRNRKTIVSVDFDRAVTCPQICSYCYVKKTETIYTGYLQKIRRNYKEALLDPKRFADTLNNEYLKLQTLEKKQGNPKIETQSIRLYGSGDFIPTHYYFIKELIFPFYIISKSLTMKGMTEYIPILLDLSNLTSIVLSFDKDNIYNYENVKDYYKKNKIKFSYTGTADEFSEIKKKYNFNIFFNIKKNKVEIEKSRKHREQCPCDTKLIQTNRACTICNKCWR